MIWLRFLLWLNLCIYSVKYKRLGGINTTSMRWIGWDMKGKHNQLNLFFYTDIC